MALFDSARKIEELFRRLDTDGSGELSVRELAEGLVSLHVSLTPRELRLFASSIDVNGNGSISFQEFLRAAQTYQAASLANPEAADEVPLKSI